MTTPELRAFNERLQESQLVPDALFAILQDDGRADESYIRANRAGLLLFAGEMIKAAIEAGDDPDDTSDGQMIRFYTEATG